MNYIWPVYFPYFLINLAYQEGLLQNFKNIILSKVSVNVNVLAETTCDLDFLKSYRGQDGNKTQTRRRNVI